MESVYEWDDGNKRYEELERNAGVWVPKEQIAHITFFDVSTGDPAERDSWWTSVRRLGHRVAIWGCGMVTSWLKGEKSVR